jgi:hypothetical protein
VYLINVKLFLKTLVVKYLFFFLKRPIKRFYVNANRKKSALTLTFHNNLPSQLGTKILAKAVLPKQRRKVKQLRYKQVLRLRLRKKHTFITSEVVFIKRRKLRSSDKRKNQKNFLRLLQSIFAKNYFLARAKKIFFHSFKKLFLFGCVYQNGFQGALLVHHR